MKPFLPQYVLLVEDDPDVRESTAEVLEGCGATVRAVTNGREALDFLHCHPIPCLIILDIIMPVMGGDELIAILRGDPKLRRIPIALYSASPYDLSKYHRHVQYVLHKPVSVSDLVAIVMSACQAEALC